MSIVISLYKSTKDTESNQTIQFNDYLSGVRSGLWQDIVLQYRNMKGIEKAEFKKTIPGVSPSGKFSKRKADAIEAHSGILCMDIDEKDNPDMQIERLEDDPYVYAYHRSVGGYGYAVYFMIEPSKHLDAYYGIEKHLADNYHLICDHACKDTSRLRFVSFDPDLYFNENKTQVFKRYLKKQKTEVKKYYIHGKQDIIYILDQIQSRNIDLVDSYYDWVNIGFALAGEYGETGREYYHIISAQNSEKYDERDTDKQYTNCLKTSKGRVSIGTFFFHCKEAGIEIQTEQTRKVMQYAKPQILKGYKSDTDIIDSTVNLAIKDGIDPEHARDIAQKTVNMPKSELQKDKQANILPEIRSALLEYDLKLNEVTNMIEYQGKPLTDWDVNTIWGEIADNLGSRCSKSMIEDIIHSNSTPSYNPFLEFFESHREEAAEGLIERLAECITFDNQSIPYEEYEAYAHAFLRKWIVSIVASMHGTYSLLILVLVGGQGIGKTNFFRWLLPEELQNYYGESKLDAGKDDAMLMCTKLILCDDEFSGKSKSEYKHIKDISSKQKITIRLPYGRRTQDFTRYAVLCGTSNDFEIINDPTGNRRIVPINIKAIDFEKFNAIDKTELFMEAYRIYHEEGNASWQLTKQDIDTLNELTTYNEQVDTVEEAILMYFEKTDLNHESNWWTTTQIITHMMQYSKLHFNTTRIGIAMKNLGFEKASKRKNGKVVRCYRLREINLYTPDNSNYG
jgi:hypothetical protein